MAIIEVTFLQCYDVILINCIMHYLISFNVLYSLPADVFLFIYLSDYVFLVHFFLVWFCGLLLQWTLLFDVLVCDGYGYDYY